MKWLVKIPLFISFMVCATVNANGELVKIQLLNDDAYVYRTAIIVTKDAKNPNFIQLESYDAKSGSFILINKFGEKVALSQDKINSIEFEQDLKKDPMVVQRPRRIIERHRGELFKEKYSSCNLIIKDGVLEIAHQKDAPDIGSVDITNQNENPFADMTIELTSSSDNVSIPEVISIVPSEGSCVVSWQWVNYKRTFAGGGGSSISTKGLR